MENQYAEPKMGNKPSEHENIAKEMANHICGFEPGQQNDILRMLKQIVAERRQLEIEKAEKTLAYLNDTFKNL